MDNQASFLATMPPLLSAFRVSGDGGCRIMIDVPEVELAEALKVLMWREQVLRVTVEPEQDADDDRRKRTEKHY